MASVSVDKGGRPPPTGVGDKGGGGSGGGDSPASLIALGPLQEAPKTYASQAKKRNHAPLKRNSLEVWIERDKDVRVTIDDQLMEEVMKKINISSAQETVGNQA